MSIETAQHARPGRPWVLHGLTLGSGAVIAFAAILFFHHRRISGDEVALFTQTHIIYQAEYEGCPIAAYQIGDYLDVYTRGSDEGPEGLWLGGSQMQAINQGTEDDHTAPYYASAELGWPTWCLSLTNASLQDHLVVLNWALTRRRPQWLIVSLVYDDLREDTIRPGMESLADPAVLESLSVSENGRRLADEFTARLAEAASSEDSSGDRSLQDVSEAKLEEVLGEAWPLWAERSDTLVAVQMRLHWARNWALGIEPSSKRKMIPVRYERNMAALREILDLARKRDLSTLLYIAPVRWDVEPPYVLDRYRDWKDTVKELASEYGAVYADLDAIVPGEDWGTHLEGRVDFGHFQDGGHRRLARHVVDLIRSHTPGEDR